MAKEKFESCNISDLINHLDIIHLNAKNNYGLYSGKTGLCICYYLISDILKDSSYKVRATEIMNELSDSIGSLRSFDFANGLSGIGWGIEWMSQSGYIDANTDEILEDLDDELYKSIIYSKSIHPSLCTGTIGKALYFYRRLIAQNSNPNRYRMLCNRECLVLLIDELDEYYLKRDSDVLNSNTNHTSSATNAIELTELAQCLSIIIKLFPYRINFEISEKLICSIEAFIRKYNCRFHAGFNSIEAHAYSYLLYTLYKAGVCIDDEKCQSLAIELYRTKFQSGTELKALTIFDNYIEQKWAKVLKIDYFTPYLKLECTTSYIFYFLSRMQEFDNYKNESWEEAWIL